VFYKEAPCQRDWQPNKINVKVEEEEEDQQVTGNRSTATALTRHSALQFRRRDEETTLKG
jgi:hypothetical protein